MRTLTTALSVCAFTASLAVTSAAWAACAGHQQSVQSGSQQTVMTTTPTTETTTQTDKKG